MPLFKKKSAKSPSNDKTNPKPTTENSLPLAMSIQRQAKKKKMAYGGKAEADGNPGTPGRKSDDNRPPNDEYMTNHHSVRPNSDTTMVSMDPRASIDSEEDGMSLAERIRRKRMLAEGGMVDSNQMGMDAIKKEQYTDGGMVDLDENDEESPNQYYKMNRKAANAHQYDDSQIDPQPTDSNEHAHMSEDEHDERIIAAIRRKMAARRGM